MSSPLEKSINALSEIDFSTPSDVEVVVDRLSSSLISTYRLRKSVFWGRAPSLGEVLKALRGKANISEDVQGLISEIEGLIKRAYDDEFDEEDKELLSGLIDELQKALRKSFLNEAE